MNVLVVGSGGREDALKKALRKSAFVKEIISIPGDMGTADCAWCGSGMLTGRGRLTSYASRKDIDFVVVGPEAPLVAGVADAYRRNGKAVFGPSQAAAMLEGSKVTAKLFCKAYNIPTADFDIAETSEQAKMFVQKRGAPIVVKADGLAGGKGVKVARSLEEACIAIDTFSKLSAGRRFIIEQPLIGTEMSYIVLTDGMHFVPLLPARDYKTIGPNLLTNTGGMGCVAPIPGEQFTPKLEREIIEMIIRPTLDGLRKEGRPFTGALYAGIMIHGGHPQLIEFNCRLGDPETQAILPLFRKDIFLYLHGTTNGTMNYRVAEWRNGFAVCVVLAAEGYGEREDIQLGDVITGLEDAQNMEHVLVFHAGTHQRSDGAFVTARGRVLNIVGLGQTLSKARDRAYKAVARIHFNGMWYREDIGL